MLDLAMRWSPSRYSRDLYSWMDMTLVGLAVLDAWYLRTHKNFVFMAGTPSIAKSPLLLHTDTLHGFLKRAYVRRYLLY